MKNFFSLNSTFNIFTLAGILIILSSFFIKATISSAIVLIGVLISWIPSTYQSFKEYKQSGKPNSILILSLVMTIIIFIMLAIEFS